MVKTLRLLILFALVSNLFAARIPRMVCKQHQLMEKYQSQPRVTRSVQRTAEEVRKAVASVGEVRSFRVNEGNSVNFQFILKYQNIIQVQGKSYRVNVWVHQTPYQDLLTDNNLNTFRHGNGSQASRITDRDAVLQEMGTILSTTIVPGTIEAFGEIQEAANPVSEGINVLVYDIQDNFNATGSFIGGYFDPFDKFNAGLNALHMDIYPSNPAGNSFPLSGFGAAALKKKDFYHVLAHEMQHLVHAQFDQAETIWVNEGLSQYAIYRVLQGKRFNNGELILNGPADEPSQVPFWLSDPSSSLLMTSDEPGISGKMGSRFDSAELRGLGYLFFTWLWEQLGGTVNSTTGNIDFSAADTAIRTMIQSSSRGIGTIQAGLGQSSQNFNSLFSLFPFALIADGPVSPFVMNFFSPHGSTRLNDSSLQLAVSPTMNPVSYSIAPYEFIYVRVLGDANTPSVLTVSSSQSFFMGTVEVDSNGSREPRQGNVSASHTVHIPAGRSTYLVIPNASLTTRSVQVSYLRSLSFNPSAVTPVNITTVTAQNPVSLGSIALLAGEVKRQTITNSSTIPLDIYNAKEEDVAVSDCLQGVNCVFSSHLKLDYPQKNRVSRSLTNFPNHNPMYLTLQPGTSYDVYYANKSQGSLNFEPLLGPLSSTLTVPAEVPEDVSQFPVNEGGGAGGCFIATASFHGADSAEVKLLSDFRDRVLLQSNWGRAFVEFYYNYSPPVASWIESRPLVGWVVQFLLTPLLLIAQTLVQPAWILLLILLMASFPLRNRTGSA